MNEINLDNENEKDIEHICILLVELSNILNLKNELSLYNKALKLFLEKNKKSKYLIEQIFDMSDDINLKKNIIKDMIYNIEKNGDSKNILIELFSFKKNIDVKKELTHDFNDELEKLIVAHIIDDNYDKFIDIFIELMEHNYLIRIIEYIINLILNQENNNNKNLSLNLEKILKVYLKKLKYVEKTKEIEKIDDFHKKVKIIFSKTNNENKKIILFCLKKLFKYSSFEYRTKIINEVIFSKFSNNNLNNIGNKLFNDIKMEPLISLIINYTLKNYEILLNKKIINDNSFEDKLISTIFEEINSMEAKNKKVFEKSLLFKIKNMPEKLKDKLLITFKKYYSSKNNENNQYLNLLMNVYDSISKEEKEQNIDVIFSLNIECINKKINPIQSIFNLRKILISSEPKEIIKLSDLFKIYPLCKNIINILIDEKNSNNEQAIKIEGIKLIGLLSGFIQEEDWENEEKKLIIFYMKKYFLSDKKRKVRYATGIVLNLLSCSTSKISFYNN